MIYCGLVNGMDLVREFYRNCVQQVKFFQSLEEIDNYVCNLKYDQKEYDKYIKCFRGAMFALNRYQPTTFDKILKCFSKIEGKEEWKDKRQTYAKETIYGIY
ncbi:uncharacterized protein [Centruroides vittatus]|uniref:uncharacterized protein n=1 Tax=Centruroides vittatus TaxID=120091 RepID=UPI00350E8F72